MALTSLSLAQLRWRVTHDKTDAAAMDEYVRRVRRTFFSTNVVSSVLLASNALRMDECAAFPPMMPTIARLSGAPDASIVRPPVHARIDRVTVTLFASGTDLNTVCRTTVTAGRTPQADLCAAYAIVNAMMRAANSDPGTLVPFCARPITAATVNRVGVLDFGTHTDTAAVVEACRYYKTSSSTGKERSTDAHTRFSGKTICTRNGFACNIFPGGRVVVFGQSSNAGMDERIDEIVRTIAPFAITAEQLAARNALQKRRVSTHPPAASRAKRRRAADDDDDDWTLDEDDILAGVDVSA